VLGYAITVLVAGTIELPKALLASVNTVSKVYAGLAVMTTAAAGVMFYAPFPSVRHLPPSSIYYVYIYILRI
jgi:hypothetical protein